VSANQSSLTLALALFAVACRPDPSVLQARAGEALRVTIPAMQAAYRKEHGKYAAHMRELTGNADTLPDGTLVLIHVGTSTGWMATSSHPSIFGAACAVFVGTVDTYPIMRGRTEPREPGLVNCTAFEPWAAKRKIEKVTIGRVSVVE
jgi:hypothetical protein